MSPPAQNPPTRPITTRALRRILTRSGLPAPLVITEHPRSGRNRLFVVTGEDRRWFAKAAASATESWFYTEVGPHLTWVPAATPVDDPTLVLTEHLDGLPTVQDVEEADPGAAMAALVALAPALAELHTWPVPRPHDVPAAAPPLPQLDPIHAAVWLDSPASSRQLLERLHRRELLCGALRDAGAGVGPQGLIHGDLKIDNVLCAPAGPVVLDWELAGHGAVGWDLGSVVGSILALWVAGLDIDGAGPEAWLETGSVPYAEVCAAVRQLVADYRKHARGQVPSRSMLATYTAAWMVGRSWADSLFSPRVNARHLLRFVIAEGLVRNPEALFGEADR